MEIPRLVLSHLRRQRPVGDRSISPWDSSHILARDPPPLAKFKPTKSAIRFRWAFRDVNWHTSCCDLKSHWGGTTSAAPQPRICLRADEINLCWSMARNEQLPNQIGRLPGPIQQCLAASASDASCVFSPIPRTPGTSVEKARLKCSTCLTSLSERVRCRVSSSPSLMKRDPIEHRHWQTHDGSQKDCSVHSTDQ